jgi:hypothetical protein
MRSSEDHGNGRLLQSPIGADASGPRTLRRAKHWALRILAIGLAIVVSVTTSPAANASANPCGNGSCITVSGTGLYVSYVQPEVLVPPLVAYYGHMETWGQNFHYNTPDIWYSNPSGSDWDRQSGARYYFNRSFPNQSKICSQFWRKNVPYQSYTSLGVACVTIHS